MITRAHRAPAARRRGSAYLLILVVSSIVMTIGLSSIAVARLGVRSTALHRNAREAEMLAAAAVELALSIVDTVPTWRDDHTHGQVTTEMAFGGGFISFTFVDLSGNGDLARGDSDPVLVYGSGRVDETVRVASVLLLAVGGTPPDALASAVHADGQLRLKGGGNWSYTTGRGGPFSTSGNVEVGTSVIGDVEAATRSATGTICGSETIGGPSRTMPPDSVFDTFAAMATEIPYDLLTSGRLEYGVLSPLENPYGQTNPDGVYFIDATGPIELRNMRIVGTLVIRFSAGSNFKVLGPVVWEPYRAGYPALLMNSTQNAAVRFDTTATTLDEFLDGVNYNPASTPYLGTGDNDQSDRYPASMRGLIHLIRDPTDTASLDIRCTYPLGSIVADGLVEITDGEFSLDPALLRTPPPGYATGQLEPVASSWRWETVGK